jgi:integrase
MIRDRKKRRKRRKQRQKRLTALEVKVLSDGVYRDIPNLFLRVRGKSRTWLFRYTFNRIQKTISFGPIHRVDRYRARDKAAEANRRIDAGEDPFEVKKNEHLELESKAGLAMKMTEMVDQYMDVHVKHMRSESGRKSAKYYCKQIIETIGEVPVRMVTTHMVLERFKLVEQYEKKYQSAKTLRSHLYVIFDMAMEPCGLTKNPVDWRYIKRWVGKIAERYEPKAYKEVRYGDEGRFLDVLRRYQIHKTHGHPNSALWLEFAFLNGGRVGEARQATWGEIDGDTWNVPKEHTKPETPRFVPITKTMHAVLEEMRRRFKAATGRVPSDDDPIFPKQDGGREILDDKASSDQINKLKWDYKIHAHGFRTTLVNWGEANGYDVHLIERQLGHLEQGVRRRYTHQVRHGSKDPTLPRRREMMEKWDEYCERKYVEYCNSVEPLPATIINSHDQ